MKNNFKILIVEDEEEVANSLNRGLVLEGFHTDIANSGSEALHKTIIFSPHIILLDRMLGDVDGANVCRELRQKGFTGKIIILTAKDEVQERIYGLDSGADDYICKPYQFDELLSRINALNRRDNFASQNDKVKEISYGSLKINYITRTVYCDGEQVDLTKREFELLNYLVINPGVVLSKQDILQTVWNYNQNTQTKIVEVYIGYLRNKIPEDRGAIKIETVKNFGYKLVEF